MVKVDGIIEPETIEKLRKGIKIDGKLAVPVSVHFVRKLKANSWIKITLHEGRKRQIRKMLQRVGHPVIRLIRISIDGVKLEGLKPGQYRVLTKEELEELKEKAGLIKKNLENKIHFNRSIKRKATDTYCHPTVFSSFTEYLY